MNIIHLVRPVSWGGGEQYVFDLCRKCQEEGDNVTVVSRGSAIVDHRFHEAGIQTVKMPVGGFLDFKTPWQLSRMILAMPDSKVVLHVHTFKDAELALRVKRLVGEKKEVKLVCTRHLVKPGKKGLRWKLIYRGIDRMIFVSQLALNEFLSGNPPIDRSKLEVVHNSILIPEDMPQVRYSSPKDKKFIILYSGRISREKGIDVLIRSLGILKDENVELRIAGIGHEDFELELMKLAEKEGVSNRITWVGFVKDVYPEIRKADICVVPSIWKEPFGLTIIEGMSQGKPVVTNNNGAQPEIITNGVDGILIPPSNPNDLASAILKLIKDPSFRLRIGENASKTFQRKFRYELFLKKIKDLYNK